MLKQQNNKSNPPKPRFNKLGSPAKANKSVHQASTNEAKSSKSITNKPASNKKVNAKSPQKPAGKPAFITQNKSNKASKDSKSGSAVAVDKVDEAPPSGTNTDIKKTDLKQANETPVDEKYQDDFSSKKDLKQSNDAKLLQSSVEQSKPGTKSPSDNYEATYDSFASNDKPEPVIDSKPAAKPATPPKQEIVDDDIGEDVYSLPSENEFKTSPKPVINNKADNDKKKNDDDIDDYIEDDFEFE